jgi:Transposase IS116/IS110/IS902 family
MTLIRRGAQASAIPVAGVSTPIVVNDFQQRSGYCTMGCQILDTSDTGDFAVARRAFTTLEAQIHELDGEINRRSKEDPVARRLMTIPGVGPITATAITALVPAAESFRVGRDFAAWLGPQSLTRSARAASAAREALLVWMGPLWSTKTTGLSGRPGHGP